MTNDRYFYKAQIIGLAYTNALIDIFRLCAGFMARNKTTDKLMSEIKDRQMEGLKLPPFARSRTIGVRRSNDR